MYSSIRVGRSVRSSCRSSSLGKLSFTRADIDSEDMLFSNPCELLETASQNRFDGDVSAFVERGVDRLFRCGALITEVEQRRERIATHGVFSWLGSFGLRAELLFELCRRQLRHLFTQLHYQTFGSLTTNAGNQRQSCEVVGPD